MANHLEEAKQKGLYARIDAYEREMVREIGELVAIPSLPTYVTEDGMEMGPEIIRALHYALDLSQRLGFRVHNENDKYGWAEIGDRGPLVCIFTHLDVVPAGDGWTKEPFVMTQEGDILYGRGTIDNKGPAISSIYALKSCCDMGVDWPCRVRVYFGTNEENGMLDVQMYIKEQGVPDYSFVPDSQFPLSYSELNGTGICLCKQYRPENVDSPLKLTSAEFEDHVNGIPSYGSCVLTADTEALAREVAVKLEAFAAEKDYRMTAEVQGTQVHIRSHGKVAYHWNEPWTAINSLAHLVLFLDTLSLGKEPDTLIHFVADKIGEETDGASFGIRHQAETGDLCLGLSAIKLDEAGLSFKVKILFSAELRFEVLYNNILHQTNAAGLDIMLKSVSLGFLRDKESPLIKALYASYCDVTGNSDPIKVCGGTYAKYVPNAVPFGAIFGPEQDICHTPDEHIRVKSELMVWTKIYANALLRICDLVTE